jgi:hypothetical protein
VEGKDVISCSEGTKLGRADAIVVASKIPILEAIELSGSPAMSSATTLPYSVSRISSVVVFSCNGML